MASSPPFFSQPFFAEWRKWIHANRHHHVAAGRLNAWFQAEEQGMHRALMRYGHSRSLAKPLKILDVGCGSGEHVIQLLKEHPAWEITGLDGDTTMLTAAEKHAKRCGVGNRARFILSEAGQMSGCSDNEYDCAICMNTFGVLPEAEQEQVIQRLMQVIRPGGLLFMSAYAEGAKDIRIESYEAVGLVVHVEGAHIVATAGLRSEAFSPERLKERVTKHGFVTIGQITPVDSVGLLAEFERPPYDSGHDIHGG